MVSLANLFTKQNNTSFPLTEKTIYANMGNRIILTEIHNAYGGWKYDDRNNTDFPIATTDLLSGQSDYALPIDTIHLNAVYYKDTAGNWTKLIPLTLEEINRMEAEPEFEDTNARPTYYRALSNSIKIYPASDYSQDDSLMVEYSRDVSTFVTTDTTKVAGFDPIFHEAIPVYMALKYAQINTLPVVGSLTRDWEGYVGNRERNTVGSITRHYSQKFKDMFPARMNVDRNLTDYL